ncbi:MAG: carbon-nitrogen hydrolase family protein [Woeseiaceae bacterium]
MKKTVRVAAAQFQVGNTVDTNLQTCLRMMRQAAENQPDLIVLPEFSNHCSWYNDADHCFEVSVDLNGPFVNAIAECVREIAAHVVINCTVRRNSKKVTGTSVLFNPDGVIVGTTDKQVLIGHENDFLDRGTQSGPVVETDLGRLAMYSCMDGVINETPRCLALRGAQILCNSLNSFALDEGSLHIPVRAAENKVWVVAANKVGPLIPEELVAPVSEATSIPAHFLDGAGDSQIVAPDGTVLAIAGKSEEIIWADIDPTLADTKTRPDGTDLFAARRPELYADLGDDPAGQKITIAGPEDVVAAAIAFDDDVAAGSATIDDACRNVSAAQAQGAKLICLPELFCGDDVDTCSLAVERLAEVIEDSALVACSIATRTEGGVGHCAVLIGKDGIVLQQPQLHDSARYRWSETGDSIETLDTEFGRLAVLCGEDVIYPETMRLAALQGVSTVLVPASPQEEWEGRTGIVERSAENRVNIVFASSAADDRSSLIASLQKDFTIMTEWKERPFDGLLSCPEVHRSSTDGNILVATVHPLAAANKECSRNTHLLASRPWQLLQPIIET